MTVTAWAKKHGFSLSATYLVLQGRTVGYRGQARQIVRAMGLALPSKRAPAKKRATGSINRAA